MKSRVPPVIFPELTLKQVTELNVQNVEFPQFQCSNVVPVAGPGDRAAVHLGVPELRRGAGQAG